MSKEKHSILVVDLGLTNCKSIVFSTDGQIILRASRTYSTYYPQPGYAEQDPDEWWQAICLATHELWQLRPELARQIAGISVTGHMHALVAIGKDGRSLNRSLVLGDQRSLQAAGEIVDELGLLKIYMITGARMDASMPAAKIRWLVTQSPGVLKTTRAFTSCKDYIRYCMTGDLLTDPIDACATSLYDIQGGKWSEELLQTIGIKNYHLPDIASPIQIAGALMADAASALGLKPGIPVVVGSGDDIEVTGNGLMKAGSSLEHFGTTGSILTCASSPIYDPQMALELYPHAQPGLWVLGGSTTAAGSALAWAGNWLGYGDLEEATNILNDWAPASGENDPLLFLPHLLGERSPSWQPFSRGAWIGLTTAQSKDDLMHAAFEGTVFALRHILDSLETLVGKQEMITVSARQERDQPWLQMRADIYNRPLGLIRTAEPTALGAMQLATVGIGLYQNLEEAVNNTAFIEQRVHPRQEPATKVERNYQNYLRARTMMADYWEYIHSSSGISPA